MEKRGLKGSGGAWILEPCAVIATFLPTNPEPCDDKINSTKSISSLESLQLVEPSRLGALREDSTLSSNLWMFLCRVVGFSSHSSSKAFLTVSGKSGNVDTRPKNIDELRKESPASRRSEVQS